MDLIYNLNNFTEEGALRRALVDALKRADNLTQELVSMTDYRDELLAQTRRDRKELNTIDERIERYDSMLDSYKKELDTTKQAKEWHLEWNNNQKATIQKQRDKIKQLQKELDATKQEKEKLQEWNNNQKATIQKQMKEIERFVKFADENRVGRDSNEAKYQEEKRAKQDMEIKYIKRLDNQTKSILFYQKKLRESCAVIHSLLNEKEEVTQGHEELLSKQWAKPWKFSDTPEENGIGLKTRDTKPDEKFEPSFRIGTSVLINKETKGTITSVTPVYFGYMYTVLDRSTKPLWRWSHFYQYREMKTEEVWKYIV